MILENVKDVKFLDGFANIQNWVNGWDISTNKKDITKKFESEDVHLDLLLDPMITLNQVIEVLRRLDLKAGVTLKAIGSLSRARKTNEDAQQKALEMVNVIKTKECELAINTERKSLVGNMAAKENTIFISYSWNNKVIVKRLYDLLTEKEKRLICWIDENKMHGGSQLFAEIDKGISNCNLFIACCSNSYGSSENCQRELELASCRKKLIIPVLVAVCDPWPPKGAMGPLLAGKLYVDLSTQEKFEKTIDTLVTAINQSLF